jgi:hypothetical protein
MIFIGAVADLSVSSVVSEIRFIRVVTLTDC